MLHGTVFNATLLREKSIPRCKNLKSVQSCSTRYGNNVALKIVCRRHVTRIDCLCNNVALKIVVKNRPV